VAGAFPIVALAHYLLVGRPHAQRHALG
jgi:hypothetical protein